MKKVVLCVVGVLLALALVGLIAVYAIHINQPDVPSTQAPGTTTPKGSEPAPSGDNRPSSPVPSAGAMFSISLPTVKESFKADDGTVIFTRTYQDVVLSLSESDTAKAVTLDLLQRMDFGSAKLSQLQTDAYRDYTGQDAFSPYSYSVLFAPTRIDGAVLSLSGREQYAGNNESGDSSTGINYDLRTGSALTLNDILSEESVSAEQFLSALLDALASQKEALSLFDNYADTVSRSFQADLQREDSWYFTDDGLCILYSPYEIAPNSMGFVHVVIPYEKLSGILQARFLPAPLEGCSGSVTAQSFDGAQLEAFSHFSELILDPEAASYVLKTDGIVGDLRIRQGITAADGQFQETAVVFAANHLSAADALILRAALPQPENLLRVEFRSETGLLSFYLSLGETGEPVLVPCAQ